MAGPRDYDDDQDGTNDDPFAAAMVLEKPRALERGDVVNIPSIGLSHAIFATGHELDFRKSGRPIIGLQYRDLSLGDWKDVGYVAGHRIAPGNDGVARAGEVFGRLPEVQVGDEVQITRTDGRRETYTVTQSGPAPASPPSAWMKAFGLGEKVYQEVPRLWLKTCAGEYPSLDDALEFYNAHAGEKKPEQFWVVECQLIDRSED